MFPTPIALGTMLSVVVASTPFVALASGGINVPAAASEGGPTIYIRLNKPDPDRGVVKLARHRNSTVAAAGDIVILTTFYDELCTEPC